MDRSQALTSEKKKVRLAQCKLISTEETNTIRRKYLKHNIHNSSLILLIHCYFSDLYCSSTY